MQSIELHPFLEAEFETVVAILNSKAKTKTVDAFILSWVKLEKQLRRIFSYLIYQHPAVDHENYEQIVVVLAQNQNLSPRTLIAAINLICIVTVQQMIGSDYQKLRDQLARLRIQRNKIAHGMVTGKNVDSRTLEKDVIILISWITKLAVGAKTAIDYDGLVRNTFQISKSSPSVAVLNWPFDSVVTFEEWLTNITNAG